MKKFLIISLFMILGLNLHLVDIRAQEESVESTKEEKKQKEQAAKKEEEDQTETTEPDQQDTSDNKQEDTQEDTSKNEPEKPTESKEEPETEPESESSDNKDDNETELNQTDIEPEDSTADTGLPDAESTEDAKKSLWGSADESDEDTSNEITKSTGDSETDEAESIKSDSEAESTEESTEESAEAAEETTDKLENTTKSDKTDKLETSDSKDKNKSKDKNDKYPDIEVTQKDADKVTKKSIFTMADTPKTPKEKAFTQKTINTVDIPEKVESPTLNGTLVTPEETNTAKKNTYLSQYLEPWKDMDPNETIEMNFENKEITELLKFLEDNLEITFILDGDVGPNRAAGLKPLAGTKITFKSNTPLTLKDAWKLGLTFLEMSGFAVVPTTVNKTYHVTQSASKSEPSANNKPVPTFIGTETELLPNSDIKIRYVYFIENAQLETITNIIDTLRSGTSGPLIKFPDLRAIIITDKSSSIKSILKLLEEVDKRGNTPETLAIIKLKHADATEVRKLYTDLIGKDTKSSFPFRQRKAPTTHYFSEATRVFDYPQTNSLIVLGTHENIKKLEDFVLKYIDKDSDLPYSPLHIYQLKYIQSESIAKILTEMIQKFNSDPARKEAVMVGGVRDGNKFFKPTFKITAEPSSNRLIINADYEDYLKITEILEKLDVEQPQVALKVLILDVDLTNLKDLGTQIRNSKDCCDGSGGTSGILNENFNFQFAGLNGLITNGTRDNPGTGAERLLGNLINLAALPSQGLGLFGVGRTLLTLGSDKFGVWGLLSALESITRISVIANPFLITSNKYKAKISVGETRRVISAIVQGQSAENAFADLKANLSVVITPQISYDDMITLQIYVDITNFLTGGEFPARLQKQITTSALVANKEVVAIGGLIRDRITETESKIPILGDIPILGYLFKKKTKLIDRTSLLILISPEIIDPHNDEVSDKFTQYHMTDAKEAIYKTQDPSDKRDPIDRWFFKNDKSNIANKLDKFTSKQAKYISKYEKDEKVEEVLASNTNTKKRLKNTRSLFDKKTKDKSSKDNKNNSKEDIVA